MMYGRHLEWGTEGRLRWAGVLCALLWSFLPTSAVAQRLETLSAVYLQEGKNASEPILTYFTFPNIQRLPFFEDRKLRRSIEDARAVKNWAELERLIVIYVRQFGIRNFRQDADLDLVWELARLNEQRGDTTKALFFYSIALKNYSRWTDSLHTIDPLRAPTAVQWVDLDHYYTLLTARQEIDTLRPLKPVHLNIGKTINSRAPDYAPYVYPTGNVLLFSSRRGAFEQTAPDYLQSEDIYYSQISPFGDSTWEPAERLPDIINSPFNEGSACLDPAARVLYFSRCNAPDVLGVCDLYQAKWDVAAGKWVDVRNLGPKVNSTAWDSHPFVSADDQTLFFCSNRDGGFGGIDLYLCRRTPKGEWGPAENLGPIINTLYNEVSPFLHPINNTLYFSSTGHLHNRGGFDIFKSRWAYNHWEEPRNLGPLVNSVRDEYYFTIDGKGENLFFAHEQPNDARNFDIFTYPMPMEARPDAVVKFGGYLLDSLTGNPLTGIVAAIDLDKRVEISPVYINPSGYFEFQLINNRRYLLAVIGESYYTIEQLELEADSVFRILVHSALEERSLVFRQVDFKLGSAEVSPGALGLLHQLADFVRGHPYCKLFVRGHTDNAGEPRYNQKLSELRAVNIQEFIVGYAGVPDSLVVAEGYGDTRPIYPNDTEEHRAKNRRVEFEVVVPPELRHRLLAEASADYLVELPETTPVTEPPGETPPPIAVPPVVHETETETEPVVSADPEMPPAPIPTPSSSTTPPTADRPEAAEEAEDPFEDPFEEDWGELDFDMDEDFDAITSELEGEDLGFIEDLTIDILEVEESSRDDMELDDDLGEGSETSPADSTRTLPTSGSTGTPPLPKRPAPAPSDSTKSGRPPKDP